MMNDLKNNFVDAWNNDGVFYSKGIFNNLPNWEEILKILNKSIRDKNNRLSLSSPNDYEIVYKDLLAIKKMSYDNNNYGIPSVDSDATFFFSVFFTQDTVESMLPDSIKDQIKIIDKVLDIKANYRSLKVALSDKFVPYESHSTGHTCVMQLAGNNIWNLRDSTSGLQKSYILEPGDLLLFKEKIEHELTNEDPRSSLVGFFDLGDSHEQ